ncbi:MAG: phosphoenolpyruvate-utilizing N-terminal domain-containing protein, partial [Planctomycetota bacterium]
MEVIKGIPVSPGVVIGRAFVLDDARERVPYQRVAESLVDSQLEKLTAAIDATADDLRDDRDSAAAKLGPEPAKIFEFHLGLLRDQTLIDPIRVRIKDENVTAAYAVAEAFRSLAARFRSMDSEVFHQKAGDIIDLDRRLLGHLLGQSRDRLDAIDEPVLVIAPELTPAQAASLDTSKVVAFATDTGGRTSHTSIVAAALSIPVVVGCKDLSRLVSDGDEVIIDGTSGVVVMRPDEDTREHYREDIADLATARVALLEVADLEPVTLDGTRIALLGNIEFSYEVDSVIANGGEGVGLFRTEFLYLTSRAEPTEDDHFEAYKDTLERLDGRPLTIRTADLGADKYTQERAEHP